VQERGEDAVRTFEQKRHTHVSDFDHYSQAEIIKAKLLDEFGVTVEWHGKRHTYVV
jgi:hypothetical protein